MQDNIEYGDFLKVQIHAGKVVEAEALEGARKPAYRMTVDFGPIGIKKSSAQLTKMYSNEELIGKTVIAVTNFRPKQIGGFMSEVLVLGFPLEGGEVVLVEPEREVPPGTRLL